MHTRCGQFRYGAYRVAVPPNDQSACCRSVISDLEQCCGAVFYSIGFYVLLGAVFALVFAVLVKRRVQNELT